MQWLIITDWLTLILVHLISHPLPQLLGGLLPLQLLQHHRPDAPSSGLPLAAVPPEPVNARAGTVSPTGLRRRQHGATGASASRRYAPRLRAAAGRAAGGHSGAAELCALANQSDVLCWMADVHAQPSTRYAYDRWAEMPRHPVSLRLSEAIGKTVCVCVTNGWPWSRAMILGFSH